MSVQLQIRRLLRLFVPAVCLLLICLRAAAQDGQSAVSFDRDIRPILSDLCFTCHGPDSQQRKSDLRLDQREGLFGAHPVVQQMRLQRGVHQLRHMRAGIGERGHGARVLHQLL